MLSALGVVILFIGSVVDVMDVSMAVIASLLCVIAVIEYGGGAPWLVWAVTGVLSLILLPQKTPAAMYVIFFGYYPIIKEKLEKLNRAVSWVLKEVIFNVALVLMLISSKLLMTAGSAEPIHVYIILAVLAEIAFPLYDVAMTRLISFYIVKLRSRFKFK